MADITWLIFTVFSWKLLPEMIVVKKHIIRAHLHLILSLISPATITLWGQMNGYRLCWEVPVGGLNYLHPTFSTAFGLTFFDSSIDLWSTIVHLLSARPERCSTQRRAPRWNNDAEKKCGQIEFFNLTARNVLTHQRDCILSARNRHWGFQNANKTDCVFLCAWGQQCLNGFLWHIRSFSFSGFQRTVGHNNRWKRREIQPKVRSYSSCWGVHGVPAANNRAATSTNER